MRNKIRKAEIALIARFTSNDYEIFLIVILTLNKLSNSANMLFLLRNDLFLLLHISIEYKLTDMFIFLLIHYLLDTNTFLFKTSVHHY